MWIHIAASSNFNYNVVDHKFMVTEHSYLPNERDFGSIEKVSRRTQHVYVPDDWCTIVEKVRRNYPFHVTKMKIEDFVSLQNVRSSIVYRKVNTHKEKVKYSHNTLEAWKVLDVHSRRQGRPPDVGRVVVVPLYTSEHCLHSNKLKDLKALLDFIPAESSPGSAEEEEDE